MASLLLRIGVTNRHVKGSPPVSLSLESLRIRNETIRRRYEDDPGNSFWW